MNALSAYSSGHRYSLRFAGVVLAWLCGVLLGISVYNSSRDIFVSLMRRLVVSPMSIVGLLSVFILPVIFVVALGFCGDSFVPVIMCAVKGFCFTVACLSCYGAYGSNGWFIQILILFTDNLSVLLLLVMSLAYFVRRIRFSVSSGIYIFLFVTVTVILDHCAVEPYLTTVLH